MVMNLHMITSIEMTKEREMKEFDLDISIAASNSVDSQGSLVRHSGSPLVNGDLMYQLPCDDNMKFVHMNETIFDERSSNQMYILRPINCITTLSFSFSTSRRNFALCFKTPYVAFCFTSLRAHHDKMDTVRTGP